MGMTAAIGLGMGGISALAGALGGGNKTRTSVNAGTANAQEKFAGQTEQDALRALQGMVNAGPGQSDVSASLGASRGLASLLSQMQASGGMPNQMQTSQAQSIMQQMFQPQQVALQQNLDSQRTQANAAAGRMGFAGNDPFLQARLASEQTRQQALLNAQQGAAAQGLAMEMPGRQLDFANQRANVLGGLASQALQNRQTLLSLGNTLKQQERDFRLQTATRTQKEILSPGQRVSNAIAGFSSGLGAGASIAGGIQRMGQQAALSDSAQSYMAAQTNLLNRTNPNTQAFGPQPANINMQTNPVAFLQGPWAPVYTSGQMPLPQSVRGGQ